MESPSLTKHLIVHAENGETVSAFGNSIIFKLTGEDTNGAIDLGLATTPPGGGTPLHVHHKDDEVFIVIEGDMEFAFNGEWQKAPAGTVVYGPKDVPHQFRNVGNTPSKHWVLTFPTGFAKFYRQSAEIFANPPIDFRKLSEITAEHGSELLERPAE